MSKRNNEKTTRRSKMNDSSNPGNKYPAENSKPKDLEKHGITEKPDYIKRPN